MADGEEGFFGLGKMAEGQGDLALDPGEPGLHMGIRTGLVEVAARLEGVCCSLVVAKLAEGQGEVVVDGALEARIGLRLKLGEGSLVGIERLAVVLPVEVQDAEGDQRIHSGPLVAGEAVQHDRPQEERLGFGEAALVLP